MDPSQIKRLKDEHHKGLQNCEEKILQWKKFKNDYEVLKQRLETLPDALSYDVTVPFGSNAFTMGKLVHTNEVMVLLGDNWFAEVSGKQAAAIVGRRIIQCETMLQDLEKEKEQFHNWMTYIDDVAGNEELVEIVEKYDEEQEKSWREQHAKNVRLHRQKMAEERKGSGSNSDEEIRVRLDSLEMTEEESEPKSVAESDGSTFDYSDEGSHQVKETGSKPISLKLRVNCNRKESREEEEEEGDCDNRKHVRWQDLSKQNIKRITFKHSKNKKQLQAKHQDPSEKEEHSLIQSPSDIYKQFGCFFPSSPPKSILKVKHSPTTDMNDPFAAPESLPIKNINIAFTGQVCEHSSMVHEEEKSRPMSHFKNSRKNYK